MYRDCPCFLASVALLACSPSLLADESNDDALRKELGELRMLATQMLERIAAIEAKLEPASEKPNLVVGAIVVVDIARAEDIKFQTRQSGSNSSDLPSPQSMAAKVMEVRPNGELVLEGHRTATNDEELWEQTITGIVPRDHVDASGHVSSQAIRELAIEVREIRQADKELKSKSAKRELRINDIVVVDVAADVPIKFQSPHWGQAQVTEHLGATVKHIHPNGDLVLSGHRHISHDHILYRETISGIVSREEVDPCRHVAVESIRDLKMSSRAVGLSN